MNRRNKPHIIVPVLFGQKNDNVMRIAKMFSQLGNVLLLGIVKIPETSSLSTGVNDVRKLRAYFLEYINRENIQANYLAHVAFDAWQEILDALQQNPSVEWLVLEWPHQFKSMGLNVGQILNAPPCNIALAKGAFDKKPSNILIPMRGGPHAEAALRMSINFAKIFGAGITVQRVFKDENQATIQDENFRGLAQVLEEMPEIQLETSISPKTSTAIIDRANASELVILGTISDTEVKESSFGTITDSVLSESTADTIAIKTKKVVKPGSPQFSSQAISILVDKWFAENTFHAQEFSDIDHLISLKNERGFTISLALPSLNEEETIGNVVSIAKEQLMEAKPLLDEIILIDSGSCDRTCEIAADIGIPVFLNKDILPQYGFRNGKGEVLWKSLYLTKGDIVIWVDTDIKNFNAHFIYGILGPLLLRENVGYVKGFYKRPILGKDGIIYPGMGGRVTELTSRPMLNLFYPQLSGVIQPLSGEYGGKREVLEKLEFTSGYGVETSLLIEVYEHYKLSAIAQVDLEERVHKNKPLHELGKMSFTILQTMMTILEKRKGIKFLDDINRSMKTIHYEKERYFLEVEEISELIRPPMIEIPEYKKKFKR